MVKSINQQLIADKLKLSRATVSRCFTNHPGINPETRGRVFELAAALGYNHLNQRQGGSAKTATQRQFVVLVCTDVETYLNGDIESPGQNLVAGVSEFAQRHRISLDLHYVSPSETSIDAPSYARVPSLAKNASAGVLLVYPFPETIVDTLSVRLPVVSLVEQYSQTPVDCVDVDHHRGIGSLVRRLAKFGHKQIGFMTHRYDVVANWALRRHSAYVEEMLRMGLTINPANELNIHEGDHWDPDTLYDRALRRTRHGVTAWVCAADHQAYGLMKFFKKRGVKVPQDVSITGFDGITPPPKSRTLTTAVIPYYEIGQIGAQRLQELAKKRFGSAQHVMLDCSIRDGKTVAAARNKIKLQ